MALIHTERYDKLDAYIDQIADKYQTEVGFVSDVVKDPVIAGFLLSKLSLARERAVTMEISGHKTVPEAANPELADDVITVLGNLIDNAFEAVAAVPEKQIMIDMAYTDGLLKLSVTDSGHGIPSLPQTNIYQRGYSTKGQLRGYGLFLVKRCVDDRGGTIDFVRERGMTTFNVSFPYHDKEVPNDFRIDCG